MVSYVIMFFLFKQKTAYELRISDWSSDVCSSDLARDALGIDEGVVEGAEQKLAAPDEPFAGSARHAAGDGLEKGAARRVEGVGDDGAGILVAFGRQHRAHARELRAAAVMVGGDRKSTRLNSSH